MCLYIRTSLLFRLFRNRSATRQRARLIRTYRRQLDEVYASNSPRYHLVHSSLVLPLQPFKSYIFSFLLLLRFAGHINWLNYKLVQKYIPRVAYSDLDLQIRPNKRKQTIRGRYITGSWCVPDNNGKLIIFTQLFFLWGSNVYHG